MLTMDEARDRLAYWQDVLRLKDWDIDVSIERRREIGGGGLGCATIDCYRRARVRLCDPIDYDERDWPIDRDMEATLVHELVHLHLDDLRVVEKDKDGKTTAEYVALERATETLARALLALSRMATQ